MRIEFTGSEEYQSEVDNDYMEHGNGKSLSEFISSYYSCKCKVEMSTCQESEDYDKYIAIFSDEEKFKEFEKKIKTSRFEKIKKKKKK
jgi:hypothetical protein